MGRLFLLFFVFHVFGACHSTVSDNRKTNPSSKVSKTIPYDPHGQLIFTRHARCRMDCRHISVKEIHEILDEGTVNYEKSDPDGRPDPKWAVEGVTDENQHLRIIVATEGNKLIIITCIELGVEWTCHCN